MAILKPLCTPVEVAQALGVHRNTVCAWAQTGRMPRPMRLGGLLFWPVEVIQAWIVSQGGAEAIPAAVPPATTEAATTRDASASHKE